MAFKTIAELSETQIKAINDYLIKNGMSAFTEAQLKFLKNFEENDPLSLMSGCAVARGFFGTVPEESFIGQDQNGLTLDQILENYRNSLNTEQLEPEELEKRLSEHQTQAELSIISHGIILESGRWAESYVVFLNSNYAPIHINYSNLEPIALDNNSLNNLN